MTNKGRAPRPARLRLLDGAQASKVNQNEPIPRSGALIPPDDMSADVRAIWDYTVVELEHMQIAAPSDRDTLVAYCEAVAKHRHASFELVGAPLLLRGQRGNMVRNPLLQVQRDAAHLIRQLAQEFGLSPSARARIDSARKQIADDDNPFAWQG